MFSNHRRKSHPAATFHGQGCHKKDAVELLSHITPGHRHLQRVWINKWARGHLRHEATADLGTGNAETALAEASYPASTPTFPSGFVRIRFFRNARMWSAAGEEGDDARNPGGSMAHLYGPAI